MSSFCSATKRSKVGSGDDDKIAAMEDAEASLTIADIEEEEASIDICVEKDGAEIETAVEEQGTSESNRAVVKEQ